MSIDTPTTRTSPEHDDLVEGAFRTERGSVYTPETADNGRTVYRRHKFDGTDHEPQPLTTFISGMTQEEYDLLLSVTYKDSSKYADDFKEYIEPYVAVIMQARLDDPEQGELLSSVDQLREEAVSYLMVMKLNPDGPADLCFAKDIDFTPTKGARVLEFRHSASKGFMVPSHLGHEVA